MRRVPGLVRNAIGRGAVSGAKTLDQAATEWSEGQTPHQVGSDSRPTVAWLWNRYIGPVPWWEALILGLDHERYRPVCLYLKQSSEVPNPLAEHGCATHYISRLRFFRWFNPWVIARLAGVLRREKVDILHCQGHQSTVYGTLAAHRAGVPVVLSHVHGLGRARRVRRRWINRLVLPRVGRILAVGEATRQDVLAANPFLPPEKVCSSGISIDVGHFADYPVSRAEARRRFDLDEGAIVVGTTGRLVPTKNQALLIEAFGRLRRRHPTAVLVIAGSGRLKEALADQAARLGLADAVRLLGHVAEVRDVLRAMDVFVLTSEAEGLPRSLIEAMAMGVPCVASNRGGMPEILCGGRYGRIIEPGDLEGVARTLIEVVDMPAGDRQALMQAAREHVWRQYDHKVMLAGLQQIYDEELARAKGR